MLFTKLTQDLRAREGGIQKRRYSVSGLTSTCACPSSS